MVGGGTVREEDRVRQNDGGDQLGRLSQRTRNQVTLPSYLSEPIKWLSVEVLDSL
jgi:hypothetical protein